MPPTRAEVQTQWSNAIKILDQTNAFGRTNATNFVGLLDTLEQSYEGNYIDEIEAAAQALRSNLAANISPALAAAVQRPFLKQYLQSVIGRTDLTSDQDMFNELFRYMVDNNLRVQSRVFTYGSPAAVAGNIGNGQLIRLTKDRYGFDIETTYIDSKRALCIADYQTGTSRGAEVFQITGQSAARDELQRSGSGASGIIAARTADDSLLFNASFQNFSGTAATSPTAITNWTSSATVNGTNFEFDSTNNYRPAPSDPSTSYALNVKATATLSQKLSVRGTKLNPDAPYLLAVIWNRQVGAASGTMVIRLGDKIFTTVTAAAQTGWVVTTAPGTIGPGAWYRNFAIDDMEVSIQWTRTGGNLLIAEVLLLEGQFFDGLWHWPIPSSAATYIPWRVNDSLTWADNSPQTGKNQTWITRAFPGIYLPHSNGSSITWADV